MVKSRFTFAGRSSDEFCLTVEKLPALSAPGKKYNTISVPGRNGDLHVEENAFQNYTQSYECYFHESRLAAPELAHAIKEWLLGSRGSQILQDTYDPNHFRKAAFLGPMEIDHLLNQYGRCTIHFDCAPQAFLHSGEEQVTFTQKGAIWNPTAFSALPIINVIGEGAGVLTIGKIVVEIKEIGGMLTLDCDMQNAYRQAGAGVLENKNAMIFAPEFPKLAAGENVVSWDGAVEKVEIIPRWWTV